MDNTDKPTDRGNITRRALVEAALIEFASSGYYGTGQREIARRAKVNQALIRYHFGNKEGLYLAVFRFICEQIQTYIGPGIDRIEAHLAVLPCDRELTNTERKQCVLLALSLVEDMVRLFASAQMSTSAQLIMREQHEPTTAFDILYEGFMKRSLDVVTTLVQRIRPTLSHQEASLSVAAILGQTLVFRAARSTLLRHLGWKDIGPSEFEVLIKQTRANVCALLSTKE